MEGTGAHAIGAHVGRSDRDCDGGRACGLMRSGIQANRPTCKRERCDIRPKADQRHLPSGAAQLRIQPSRTLLRASFSSSAQHLIIAVLLTL